MSTSGPPPTESTPDPPRSSAFSGTPEVVTEPKTVVRPAGTPESGSHVLDSLADFQDVAGVGGGSGSLSNRLFPPDGVETGPLDGISLGHFTIERRIGRGGMGAVFRAIDARLQRPVALKVLSPSLSRDESAVARFLNEARSAAQLDDDHVARVFHYGDDDGLHYIAFEYIEGLDIRQRIRRDGRLRIGEALGIATQLAMALRATSAVDVVHRDIKPSNVIVTSSGRVKLVDLGLARKPPSESVGELTVPGTTLGTFDYISPEQAKDPRDVDVRSDLYSLGCTLYHMLTGEPPYPEGTLLQKLLDHQDKAVPDPRRITPAVPAAVAALCMRLMSPDPAERPQTAEEALTELAAAARRSGVRRAGVSYTGMPQPPTRREGQAKTWAIGAGLAAAVVAALFAADTFSRTQRTPDSFDELNATTRVEEPTAGDGLSVRDDVPAPRPNADPVEARDVVETDASAPAIAAGGSVDGDVPTESAADTDIEASSLADVSDEILPTEIDEIEEQFPAFASTEDPAGDRKPAVSDVPTIFPQAPSVAAIGPPPFLLVDPGGDGTPFRTLEAACTAAADGDVIELDFDGRSRPETLGVRLGRKTLTLRPAVTDEGVARRPVIVFAPDADATSPAAFFIAGGGVNLFGLAIDVVGDGPTGGTPAVADISGVGRLRLDGVVVTLGEDVTLMRFEDAIGSDPFAVAGSPATAETAFEVELDDSIIRGEGSLFAGRLGVAGRVEVDGSVVALGRTAFTIEPADTFDVTPRLDITSTHATWLVPEGFLAATAGAFPAEPPVVSVTARDSIFSTLPGDPVVDGPPASDGAPLVSLAAEEDIDGLETALRWFGQRNHYEGVTTWLTVAPIDEIADPENFDFDRWLLRFDADESGQGDVGAIDAPLPWQVSFDARPLDRLTPADVTLDALLSPTLIGTDGDVVGADAAALPRFESVDGLGPAAPRPVGLFDRLRRPAGRAATDSAISSPRVRL